MGNSDRKPGLIKRLWKWWRTPSRLALGTLLLIGFVGGIVFWGGFNTGMEKAASVRPVRIVTFRTSLCRR